MRFTKKEELSKSLATEYDRTDARGHGIYLMMPDWIEICRESGLDPDALIAVAKDVLDDDEHSDSEAE
jgi:hypothetical protein